MSPHPRTSGEAPGLQDRIDQTLRTLKQHWDRQPSVAIVLGSGLGQFVEAIDIEAVIPYAELPHFPCATSIGHASRLVCGQLHNAPIAILQGRCHLYEGHQWDTVTYPLRALRQWGVQTLVVTCAAGGLAPGWAVGDLMIFDDHLNFNMPRFGAIARQESMQAPASPYCPRLQERLSHHANRLQIPTQRGVYIGVTGPNYETRAEQRMFRMLGDAIGMSTIPETIVAYQLGMNVAAVATITNLCDPDQPIVATGDHVVAAAARAEPRFRKLVTEFLRDDRHPTTC